MASTCGLLSLACEGGSGHEVHGRPLTQDGGSFPESSEAGPLNHFADASGGDAEVTPMSDGSLGNDFRNLCDGSEALRLFYLSHGYRPSVIGSDMMNSPGVPYIMLDGKCRLYVRYDSWDPVTVRVLNTAELTKLVRELDVSSWAAGRPRYCMFAYDAPLLHSFGAAGVYWDIEAETTSADCPSPPTGYLARVQEHASQLRPLGQPVEGKVAFSLVLLNSAVLDDSFRGATPWPLGMVEHAVTDDGTPFRFVEGEEATRLRALRERYLRGELGSTRDRYIPVQQEDGARYELRMRDVIPLEDEQGRVRLR